MAPMTAHHVSQQRNTGANTPYLKRLHGRKRMQTSNSVPALTSNPSDNLTKRLNPLRKTTTTTGWRTPKIIKGSTQSYDHLAEERGDIAELNNLSDEYSDRIGKQKRDIEALRGQLNKLMEEQT